MQKLINFNAEKISIRVNSNKLLNIIDLTMSEQITKKLL